MPYSTEIHKIGILMMIGYGDRTRIQNEVIHLFREYPDLPPIWQSTISKIEKQFRKNGHLQKTKNYRQSALNEDVEMNVLLCVGENHHVSTKQIAREFEISQSSVMKILNTHEFHPYKMTILQELTENDPDRRIQFCEEMNDLLDRNVVNIGNVLFSDESTFTLNANLMAISDGMTVGWSAPMIPYFISEESHIPMDRHQAEWIENWVLIGAVAGLPFTIYLVDKVGRKKSLLLASLNLLVAWVIIAFSKTLVHLYVARFISGIGGDMAFVAAPMYIAEIADQKIRGFLSSIIYLMMLTGVITVYIVGPYLPFYVPPVIGGILLIIELIVFSFLPETPYFLAFNGKHEEARKSLEKFRSGRSIEKEITEIHIAVERRRSEKGRIQDIFHVKNYRKAMLIMTVLNAAQQLSSINVILMNMHQILEEAGSIYVDPMIAAIIFASLMFVAALTASGTIDKFGRKALLIFSSIMTGFCLLSLAIYFNIKNSGMEWRSISWIPIASLMVYALVFKYGLGMVPIVITAEIFAPEMKAVGMTIADAVFVLAAIGSINLFQKLSGDYGMHVPFYISACCSFLTTLYVALFIPETKGKTLEEIQLILQGKSKAKPYIKTNDEVQVEK